MQKYSEDEQTMQVDQEQNLNPVDAGDVENISNEDRSVQAQTEPTRSENSEASEKVPHRKVRTGTVVSNKMDKSIVVLVTRRVRHPLYKKYFYKSKKFMAHDEVNECNIGDTVRIIESRPLSAKKRWRLDTIVERAK